MNRRGSGTWIVLLIMAWLFLLLLWLFFSALHAEAQDAPPLDESTGLILQVPLPLWTQMMPILQQRCGVLPRGYNSGPVLTTVEVRGSARGIACADCVSDCLVGKRKPNCWCGDLKAVPYVESMKTKALP